MAKKQAVTPTDKKKGRPPLPESDDRIGVLTLKRSPAYQEWLKELTIFLQRKSIVANASHMADVAFDGLAKMHGFEKERPLR